VRASGVAIALLLAGAAAGGCGSSSDDGSGEVTKVIGQLKSLRKGEILIQGMTSPRVIGPYAFKPGGYVLRFEQPGAPESERERLVVALESKPRTRAQPYQLLVDSDRGSGTKGVSVSGKLYVHVVRAPGDYVLRFTPRRR
jgi:hypothetical protein